MVAVDGSDNNAGNFTVLDTSTTKDSVFLSKEYIHHRNASSLRLWNFNWTAPSSDVGPITFYYTLNTSNNDGTASGDSVIQGSRTFPVDDAATGINAVPVLGSSIYPNPVTGNNLVITLPESMQANATLINLNGRIIEEWEVYNSRNQVEFASTLATGLYLLHVDGGENGNQTHKILVE
jgi:hypothetical protein